jgi:hypothetical protein
VEEALDTLERALEECRQARPWACSGSTLANRLDRLVMAAQQVAALQLALIREVDGRGVAVGAGASSTAARLTDRYRISGREAARQVRLARALDASATAAALAAGEVNVEQAQVIVSAVDALPPEHRAAGEEHLLGEAATFGPRELGRLGQRLFEVVAPEEAEQRALAELERAERRAFQDRGLWLTDVAGTSRVRVTGWLDQDGAATVRAALDPLCAPRAMRRAGRRSGDPETGSDNAADPSADNDTDPADVRSAGQRRVDALVEVCRLASACGELPDNGGDRPQVVVTIDYESLRDQVGAGTFDDGAHLSPVEARRIACDAGIIPAVLGGASQILDLGRQSRLVTGPLRRALVLRERGCGFPGCDRPPRWCQSHHIVHWSNHGPTDLGNLVLLCGYHHRLVHHSEWRVRINPKDGLPDFIPPAYIDPDQSARRNRYHRRE